MIHTLSPCLPGLFSVFSQREYVSTAILISQEVVRVLSHVSFLCLIYISLGRGPDKKRLLIGEALYWIYRLVLTLTHHRFWCPVGEPWIAILWIPAIMFLFREQSILKASYLTLIAYAALQFLNALMCIFVPLHYLAELYKIGLTAEELIAAGQSIIVLLLCLLHRHLRTSVSKWHEYRSIRVALIVQSILIIGFYLGIRPGLEHYLAKSLLLGLSIGFFALIYILIVLWAFYLRKHQQLREMEARIAVLETDQKADQEFIHEAKRTMRYLETISNNAVLDALLRQTDRNAVIHQLPPVIRNIVASYMGVLAENHIDLRLKCLGHPTPWPYTEQEMLSLLGNLFDNAITAVKELPEDGRYIDLTFEEDEIRQALVMQNPYLAENFRIESLPDRHLLSSPGRSHGHGLDIVTRLVHRKDGVILISPMKAEFRVRIDLFFWASEDTDPYAPPKKPEEGKA
ncbi:MAG: GHKL domain-containing protein [Firmicutes bacterium]|nr:GHKL domain-containing protein [Bacillota bacterium]